MKAVFILLIVSNTILTIFWVIILQKLCITSIKNRQQIVSTVFAFLFCTICIIINIIYYLSTLYSSYILFAHFKVTDLRNVFEVITVLIGSHIYRIFLTVLYESLYKPMPREPPTIIQKTPVIIQCAVIIALVTCYSCRYFLHQNIWLYLFYVILDVIILVSVLVFAYIYVYIWKVFHFSAAVSAVSRLEPMNNNNARFMIGTMVIAVTLSVADIVVIFISLDFIFDFTAWSYNEVLMGNIVYSLFIIMLNIPLFVWAYDYEEYECCIIDQDSVCLIFGCGGCCKIRNNINNREVHNQRLPILLDESKSSGNRAVIAGHRPSRNSTGNQTVVTVPTVPSTLTDLRQQLTWNSSSLTGMLNK